MKNKGNNRILPSHCAVCIYGACLKWLLSFSDRWLRGTKTLGTRLYKTQTADSRICRSGLKCELQTTDFLSIYHVTRSAHDNGNDFHANQTHFHLNGFALRLVLKQRHKGLGNSLFIREKDCFSPCFMLSWFEREVLIRWVEILFSAKNYLYTVCIF